MNRETYLKAKELRELKENDKKEYLENWCKEAAERLGIDIARQLIKLIQQGYCGSEIELPLYAKMWKVSTSNAQKIAYKILNEEFSFLKFKFKFINYSDSVNLIWKCKVKKEKHYKKQKSAKMKTARSKNYLTIDKIFTVINAEHLRINKEIAELTVVPEYLYKVREEIEIISNKLHDKVQEEKNK